MGLIELAGELQQMLHEAGHRLTAANKGDFQRFIRMAATDLAHVRPRTLVASLTLVADQAEYPAPADLVAVKAPARWGLQARRTRKPWADNWPGRLPTLRAIESGGATVLHLDPAPSAAQIADLGADYSFYYLAGHRVALDGANTTVRAVDRDLLLVRAMVFALRELAADSSVKPTRVGDGIGNGPRNGTPSALADAWYKEFERMAGRMAA